jgi:LacI family transcriptional regulator
MKETLYLKIKKDLQKKIEEGYYKKGLFLPYEKKLSNKYKVSLITIKRALFELENEGLIIKQQGKGSYIKKIEIHNSIKSILVILPLSSNIFFYDEFYGDVWRGMENEANLLGHNLLYTIHSPYSKNKNEFLNSINKEQICGVVIVNEINKEILFSLQERNIPFILVDYNYGYYPAIITDNIDGAFEAVNYLISSGHKKIACISIPTFGKSFNERIEGYKKALKFNKIEEQYIYIQEKKKIQGFGMEEIIEFGYHTCQKLLKDRKDISAIFCVNDSVAIGAMKAIKEHGLKIPEDISIVGFDGIESSQFTQPSLTTMEIPKEKMGRLGIRKIIEIIEERKIFSSILISPVLKIRDSVCRKEGNLFYEDKKIKEEGAKEVIKV